MRELTWCRCPSTKALSVSSWAEAWSSGSGSGSGWSSSGGSSYASSSASSYDEQASYEGFATSAYLRGYSSGAGSWGWGWGGSLSGSGGYSELFGLAAFGTGMGFVLGSGWGSSSGSDSSRCASRPPTGAVATSS